MSKTFIFGLSTVITVLQFASMAFLIICCVTAPVFSQIGISTYEDVTYGIFGYCRSGSCSLASANYKPESLAENGDWKMDYNARSSLSKILIATPIAAGLAFFAMFSNLLAQFGNINKRASVFLINLLLTLIAFAVSALSCIVVFLLFFPNMTWCSYLLIPAAAINLVSLPLVYFAHSQGSGSYENSVEDEDRDFMKDNGSNEQVYTLDGFEDESSDRPVVLPDYYKNPQIITSTTLTSTNSNSKSDSTAQRSYNKPLVVSDEDVQDASYIRDLEPSEPYSAIRSSFVAQDSRSSSKTNIPQVIAAPSQMYPKSNQYLREFSSSSSQYSVIPSKTPVPVPRKDPLNNVALNSDCELVPEKLEENEQESAPTHDVLQDIIDTAISEGDEDEDLKFIKQNTIDPSERPDLDDDDGIEDGDSDFTSVSQRGVNPDSYPSAPINGHQARPQATANSYQMPLPGRQASGQQARAYQEVYSPQQQHQQRQQQHQQRQQQHQQYQQQHQQYQQYQCRQQQQYAPPPPPPPPPPLGSQRMPPSGYVPNGYSQQAHYNQQPHHQQFPQMRQNQYNFPGTSEILLSNNPDFMISGSSTINTAQNRANLPIQQPKTVSSHYVPSYKKRLPRQNMPPASSIARDNPYAGFR